MCHWPDGVPLPANVDNGRPRSSYLRFFSLLPVFWPFWFILNVCPATAIWPVLGELPRFSSTVNLTVPLPLPDEADAMIIHGAFATAFHSHPLSVFTEKLPLASPWPKFWLVFDRLYEHEGAAGEALAAGARETDGDPALTCADVGSVPPDAWVAGAVVRPCWVTFTDAVLTFITVLRVAVDRFSMNWM